MEELTPFVINNCLPHETIKLALLFYSYELNLSFPLSTESRALILSETQFVSRVALGPVLLLLISFSPSAAGKKLGRLQHHHVGG